MDYPHEARARLGNRSLAFFYAQGQAFQYRPEHFRHFVETAVRFGATHVQVGQFSYRHGTSFLPDNHDPYACWCNTSLNLLWTFPPEALREWIPAAEVAWRQEMLAAQIAEARRHGLKAVANGAEPLWLPEAVYRAHPHWRGAQCELSRIARRPYFAPSIDEPEVLTLYRDAMQELSTKFPEIERLSFLSNDSGAGLAWTPNSYPGMNGPLKWRLRDPGERIAGWLCALQEGAAQAGVKVAVNLHSSGLSPEIRSATRQHLKAGQYLNGQGRDGKSWSGGGASLGHGLWSAAYPVAGMADPGDFVRGLQTIYHNPENDHAVCEIAFDETHTARATALLESFLADPGDPIPGVVRERVLHHTARTIACDDAGATTLVRAWEALGRATHAVLQVRQKGFGLVMPFCGVSMRWIVRPLVPQPLRLTPEQTAYYARFLLSVDPPQTYASFSSVLGKQVFRGESAMWLTRWCLEEAFQLLRAAARSLGDGNAALRLEAARFQAFASIVKTIQNVVRYQYALDVAHHPQFGWNVMDYDENMLYDQRSLQLRKIAREEVDNAQELIALIRSQSEPVVVHATEPGEESVFLLGPDLVDDLHRKVELMLDSWQDYETLYPSTKVQELEPGPTAEATP